MQFENSDIDKNLRQLKVDGGFIVPENYFDGLKSSIKNQINQNENSLPHSTEIIADGFITPPDYFNNLKENILVNINTRKAVKPNLRLVYSQIINIAAILFVVSFLYFYKDIHHAEGYANNWKDLSDKELIDHLNTTGYSVEMLCDAGFCDDLLKVNDNNGELEKYLIDNTDLLFLQSEL